MEKQNMYKYEFAESLGISLRTLERREKLIGYILPRGYVKEQQVIDNRQLSNDEKEQLLAQKSAMRYALKWKVELYELNQDSSSLSRGNIVTVTLFVATG